MSDGYEPSADAVQVFERLSQAASRGGLQEFFAAYVRADLETMTIRLPTGDRLTLDASPSKSFFTIHNQWGRLHTQAAGLMLNGPQFVRVLTTVALPFCRPSRGVPLDATPLDSGEDTEESD